MKKILTIVGVLLSSLLLAGCSCTKMSATGAVKDFLDQYRNLSSSVLTDLEKVIAKESFNDKQKEKYRDILKKQYTDLKYEVTDESYDGDNAVVKTKISVYDLYKVQSEAATYLTTHMDEFKNGAGSYDNDKFLDYKLDQMKKNNNKVEYTINFNVIKGDKGNWKVKEITTSDLEKIHGIYNYDTEK
ncbi:MAG: hypothetical protein RSF02_03310 [Bacilli bacterium]